MQHLHLYAGLTQPTSVGPFAPLCLCATLRRGTSHRVCACSAHSRLFICVSLCLCFPCTADPLLCFMQHQLFS